MIGFLKKEGGQKDEQVEQLCSELDQLKEEGTSEREAMASQYKSTVDELEEQLQEKADEVNGRERER